MVFQEQHLLVRIAGSVTVNRGEAFICHPAVEQAGGGRRDLGLAGQCSPVPRFEARTLDEVPMAASLVRRTLAEEAA